MSEAASFRDPRILLPFLLITLIWSSTWIVIKDQLGTVPGPWSVTYRFLVAGIAMVGVARLLGHSLAVGRTGHLLAMTLGLLQFVLNFNFVYAAEHHVTSGLVAVVFALLIVPNALFARLFFGQAVSGRFLAGSAVALTGVALLFIQEMRQSGGTQSATLLGLGLTALGVLSVSIANVMQLSHGLRSRPLAAMLAWGMLYGALIDGIFAWMVFGPPVGESRTGYWLGVVYLGLAGSTLAFLLYFRIVRAVGPAKAAYSSVLVPILAMAISTVAEGYRWSPLAAAGGALGLAGLVIALKERKPAPAAEA